MQVTPLVKHLRDYCPVFARAVSGGIDWEAIESSTQLKGLRAHVVLTDERADPPETNVISQDVAEEFDVCVEFPQAQGDEKGQMVADQIDDVRRALFRALVGWKPTTEHDPVQYVARQLLLTNRAKSVYRFSFITGYRIGRNEVGQPPETFEELELDGLPELEGVDVDLDFIDPMVDPNLSATGPDGRVEMKLTEELKT